MIDAVWSPHINGLTCGTAKWNLRLAEQLGVPCQSLSETWARHPLISARFSELSAVPYRPPGTWDVLVHDVARGFGWLITEARRVYAANSVLAEQLRTLRPDVQTICCPSSLRGEPSRGAYQVLTYGMAHKITAPHYEHLKYLLDTSGHDYTISLSTAVHEGSPWDESLQSASAMLRGLFGGRLRVLGYLADDALARELAEADVVALFYDPALRSNNTTAWAALEAGRPLVTNCDEHSPLELSGRVINLPLYQHWPCAQTLRDVAKAGRQTAREMGWERLIETLRAA